MLTAVHAHCPPCFTWTNWSSKLFVGWCSHSLISICSHGHCVSGDTDDCRASSETMMRFLAAFLIFLCVVGYIGCKPSSQCPGGQFALKNQCVLCHPTCSECNGHELFECTTCGVGEKYFLSALTAQHRRDLFSYNKQVLVILRFSEEIKPNWGKWSLYPRFCMDNK